MARLYSFLSRLPPYPISIYFKSLYSKSRRPSARVIFIYTNMLGWHWQQVLLAGAAQQKKKKNSGSFLDTANFFTPRQLLQRSEAKFLKQREAEIY